MKRLALTLLLVLGACAPATAKVHTGAPSGNSGVDQYLETVPTVHGNRPTNSVHLGSGGGGGTTGGGGSTTGGGAAAGAGGTGSAGGGGSSGSGSGSPISASTQRALNKQGAAGRAAAAMARATGPGLAHGGKAGGAATGAGDAISSQHGRSALHSLVAVIAGSASDGGLGLLLPVILIVALFGTAMSAVLRRRAT